MYKFNGKPGKLYKTELDEIEEMRLNSNCPDSEKSGSGPGSCGGATGKSSTEKTFKPLKNEPASNQTYYEKAASKEAKRAFSEYGESKSGAVRVLKQAPEQIDKYLDGLIDTEWNFNFLPGRPDLEGNDKQFKEFSNQFKKEYISLLKNKARKTK